LSSPPPGGGLVETFVTKNLVIFQPAKGDHPRPCRYCTLSNGNLSLLKVRTKGLDKVKLFPGLSAAALKARLDKELALWCELRAINSWGSGRLLLGNAIVSLVCKFGYSQSTAYRLLKAGNGKLWEIDDFYCHPVVKIHGLYRVVEKLGVSHLGRPVEVSAAEFRGRKAKRAWLYASFFRTEGTRAKPISRDSIQEATGVQRRRQQRYDKAARIRRVANFAFYRVGGCLAPLGMLVASKARQYRMPRRLGNTYHSRAVRANRGMTRNGGKRSSDVHEARLPRRFFFNPKALARSHERADEPFLLANRYEKVNQWEDGVGTRHVVFYQKSHPYLSIR
jgi:hypothetical protein